MQALSIPPHLLMGPSTCSSSSSDFADAFAYSMRAVRMRLERERRREEAVCLIYGRLEAAGIKGNLRNLATSLWMAEECFDRSLDVLARYHRLGAWRFRRLA